MQAEEAPALPAEREVRQASLIGSFFEKERLCLHIEGFTANGEILFFLKMPAVFGVLYGKIS